MLQYYELRSYNFRHTRFYVKDLTPVCRIFKKDYQGIIRFERKRPISTR